MSVVSYVVDIAVFPASSINKSWSSEPLISRLVSGKWREKLLGFSCVFKGTFLDGLVVSSFFLKQCSKEPDRTRTCSLQLCAVCQDEQFPELYWSRKNSTEKFNMSHLATRFVHIIIHVYTEGMKLGNFSVPEGPSSLHIL
jgi:hypothetical protein